MLLLAQPCICCVIAHITKVHITQVHITQAHITQAKYQCRFKLQHILAG